MDKYNIFIKDYVYKSDIILDDTVITSKLIIHAIRYIVHLFDLDNDRIGNYDSLLLGSMDYKN